MRTVEIEGTAFEVPNEWQPPLPWQDPDLYIIGEEDGCPIWATTLEQWMEMPVWNDGEPFRPDEQTEWDRRQAESARED